MPPHFATSFWLASFSNAMLHMAPAISLSANTGIQPLIVSE